MKPINCIRSLNFFLIASLAYYYRAPYTYFPIFVLATIGMFFLKPGSFRFGLAFVSLVTLVFIPRYQVSYRVYNAEELLSFLRPLKGFFFSRPEWDAILLQGTVGIVFLAVCKLLWKQWHRPLNVMPFVVAFIASFAFLRLFFAPQFPWVSYFLALCVGVVSRGFLALLYFKQVNSCATLRWRDAIWISPFWQTDIQDWSGKIPGAEDQREDTQYENLRNILHMWFAFLSLEAIGWVLFRPNWLNIPNLLGSGTILMGASELTPLQCWANVIYSSLYFIVVKLWMNVNLVLVMLSTAGYPMQLGFERPWKAASYSDFVARMHVYYSRVLTTLFFFPVYQKLRFLRRFRPLDQGLALFSSIFIFSMVYHTSREYQLFFQPNALSATLNAMFKYSLFSILLAVSVCVSLAIERSVQWRERFFWFRIPLYFFIYTIITLVSAFEVESMQVRIKFVERLFWIS